MVSVPVTLLPLIVRLESLSVSFASALTSMRFVPPSAALNATPPVGNRVAVTVIDDQGIVLDVGRHCRESGPSTLKPVPIWIPPERLAIGAIATTTLFTSTSSRSEPLDNCRMV